MSGKRDDEAERGNEGLRRVVWAIKTSRGKVKLGKSLSQMWTRPAKCAQRHHFMADDETAAEDRNRGGNGNGNGDEAQGSAIAVGRGNASQGKWRWEWRNNNKNKYPPKDRTKPMNVSPVRLDGTETGQRQLLRVGHEDTRRFLYKKSE